MQGPPDGADASAEGARVDTGADASAEGARVGTGAQPNHVALEAREKWVRWVTWTSLAASAVAALDLVLSTIGAPATTSSLSGALQTWAVSTGALALWAVPIALALAFLDRPIVLAAAPSSAAFTTSAMLAVLGTVALLRLERLTGSASEEFAVEPVRAQVVASVVILTVLGLSRDWLERLLVKRWPDVRAARTTALLVLAAAAAMFLAHRALLPLYQVSLAGVAALGSVAALALALRRVLHIARRRDNVIVVSVIGFVALVGLFAPPGREHARFVLFNHSASGALAEWLRDFMDSDGDAALSRLAGGTDCDDSTRGVGPLQREIPGDGVDQDCRGGDSAPAPPLPAPALPEGCRPQARAPSVLLLIVDALRADTLVPEVMPATLKLAEEAWTFERAYAPTAMTVTSVASIFAARALSDVGADNPLIDGSLTARFTLAERFRDHGYRTFAFSDFLEHPFHRRGFDAINPGWRDFPAMGVKRTLMGAATSRAILDALATDGQPAFIWAHFSDTHGRYKLATSRDGRPLDERAAYLRGAAYVDKQLERLLAGLADRGRLDDTIVVVSADHGEELMDHGHQGHGGTLFEESVRVPLVVRVPGCPPRRFARAVSNRGVGPTLGTLTGIEIPGRGLFDQNEPVVIEGPTGLNTHFKRAIIGDRYKLIVDVANGGALLFDLERDPSETEVIDEPAARADLEAAYQRWLDTPGAR